MKIASVTATPVTMLTTRPCAWSRGTGFGFTRTVLELKTGSGQIGLGECEGAAAARLLNGPLGKKLIGIHVHDLPAVGRLCHLDFHDYGCLDDPALVKIYAAVEMAMWDLAGKAAGVPVYKLLGGAARPAAEFGAYGYTVHLESAGLRENEVPAAMARSAAESIARTGAGIYEFKVGRYSIETDIETIRAVRGAIGDRVHLGIDANQALSFIDARRMLQATTDVHLDWFEEPVASFAEMSRLHEEFRVPLSSHCIDAEKLLHYPAIHGVVGDLHLQGGLLGLNRAAAGISALGKRFWQRSSLELGISFAAMVHAGLACRDLGRASQCLVDYVQDDLIVGEPWKFKEGGVTPPHRPGLGVELDRAALTRGAELFREKGEMTYFDAD